RHLGAAVMPPPRTRGKDTLIAATSWRSGASDPPSSPQIEKWVAVLSGAPERIGAASEKKETW
ncbi:MAG TPA: hypothetical protein VL966_17295, partial [Alphaproteobacteria bacterium]|nr:hypothetical protein [Alphaproteobacteria bacterium]